MKTPLFLLVLVFSGFVLTTPVAAQSKEVVGWLEKVRIYPGNLLLHAKVDTGAENSSLNASHIIEFERDGQQWVRFDVTDRNRRTVTFEQRLLRVAKIKRHGSKPQPRFAILLGICLGNIYKEVEVNLVDRSDFVFQMLIGRSFTKGRVIIDPSEKYLTKPKCEGVPKN
ncbi:MAG: ATP-dependent zinc protease [Deltaproteobacteria bacterium]|nr:MAG: ATP-dependent zinc protease [Deltaproteobacteria bacterium]